MSEWVETTLGNLFVADNEKLGEHATEPTVLSLSKYDGFVRADDFFDRRIASANLDQYKPVALGGWAFSTIHIDEGSIARNTCEPGVISPMYTTMRWIGDALGMPEYVDLIVRQPSMLDEYRNNAQGSINRRRSLPFKSFAAIPVSLPPLAEQRRIVAVMSAVDAQIEALALETESLLRLLEILREQLPEAEDALLADFIVGIDSGKSVQTGGQVPAANERRILKVSAVRPGLFRPDEAKRLDADLPTSALVEPGDLLMTRSNTPDRVGYVARARAVPPGTYMPDLIWRVRLDEAKCDADYFEQALASPLMRSRITATATGTSASMRKINKRGVSTVGLPLPPLERQRSFAETCLAVSRATDALTAELAALRTVRADLLTALLAQEITVDEAVDRYMDPGAEEVA